MKYIIQFMSLFFLLAFNLSASASLLECTLGKVFLTDVQLAVESPTVPFPDTSTSIPPQSYTACEGVFSGNDQPYPGGANIGEYMDGLLNGQPQTGGQSDLSLNDELVPESNSIFDPFYLDGNVVPGVGDFNENLAFIDPTTDLQNLTPGDEVVDDPGWVFLGKDDGDFTGATDDEGNEIGDGIADGFQYAHTGVGMVEDEGGSAGNLDGFDIGDLINVDFTCYDDIENIIIGEGFGLGGAGTDCTQGTWSIMPDWDIVNLLDELFGEGVFDHLALVFKSGPEFAVFDFNFQGSPLNLEVPYNLGGTFDVSDVFENSQGMPKGISHISVWARDPASITTEMPEPKSTMLMLLAVALLVLRVKSKHTLL